ncbi:MAG: alpha/beta hydrolase [Alphaproteobacteria bacterium]|nr:alpha/beta hydrolase [Alphaproteobacteria bacterium]
MSRGTTPHRSIPENKAERFFVPAAGGINLSVYRLTGPAASGPGPVLLCGHATGMAAGSYLPWFEMLAHRAVLYAFDARGHGGSDTPPDPLDASVTLDTQADDLAAVTDAVCRRENGAPVYYAAHSISGAAALHLGIRDGAVPWAGMTLFEPPIMIGRDHQRHPDAMENSAERAQLTERRRARWQSPAAFADKLATHGAFSKFDPAMLAAHCEATLRPDGDEFELACAPRVEAAFFRSVHNTRVWDGLPKFPFPARFVGGDPEIPDPGTGAARWVTAVAGDVAARVRGSRFTVVPDSGHMMVCERPDRCRDLVFDMIDAEAERRLSAD